MQYPKPTIDVVSAATSLFREADSSRPSSFHREELRGLLAQAWEEGRWAPPGPVLNPYGLAAKVIDVAHETQPGAALVRLRDAARAALAWLENMPTTLGTVGRRALVMQLRSALEDK